MNKMTLPDKRRVKHLTLLRQPREISGKEFNALSFDERLAMVQSLRGRRQYDLLIEAADMQQLVQRMPMQELYLLIRELGAEDVLELLALATPEQINGFIDLDCWQGDLLDPRQALHWLTLVAEAEEDQQLRVLTGIEFELLTLMFKKWMRVTRGPEDFDDEDERDEAILLNGGFVIEYSDSEVAKLLERLLGVLFRRDPVFHRRLVESIRQELDAALEEEVFRWRNGRLLDQGFPEPYAARGIYAWLDPETFSPADARKTIPFGVEEDRAAPGFVLAETLPKNLLAEVLAGGLSDETAWELTCLLNKLLVADGIDAGDVLQVDQALRRLYATLNLALEKLCGQDVAQAAELFESSYLEILFRFGFSLLLQLQGRARALLKSSLAPYFDAPCRALLENLAQPRPECWEGILEVNRGGSRPFESLTELQSAEDWLRRLEVQRRLFEEVFPFTLPEAETFDLTGCQPDELGQISLSTFFLTALGNQLLGGEFVPEPIPAVELVTLHGLVGRDGRVDPDLRNKTVAELERQLPGGGSFADWCLAVWDEEFCNLDVDSLDPRFVGGLIVRLD
ncbi:DUF6178 family protein [Geothermobacter hydrogeniphilus]|uniref:Uncharacterized protein n=1 Tax=Geothermobacter hydrogeniphilus TaxID=1969733 RepID=A0A1X0YCZ1_9BACT|nr:DUF6178 family protein [Geothermobacter hydrogeniphilus]ORJ62972.1 hypothetical protein B5V00_02665 [Geothermobacter hydrogeniphilus]